MPVSLNNPDIFYQSPPNSGSNDGATPTVYDPNWPMFINLAPNQKLGFQSFPQDLQRYAVFQRWQAENMAPPGLSPIPVTVTVVGQGQKTIQLDMTDRGQARLDKLARKWGANAVATTQFRDLTGTIYPLNSAALQTLDTQMTNFIEQLFTTLNTLVGGINATPATITTRKQIDAAIAAVAPNSPSATNPSPT